MAFSSNCSDEGQVPAMSASYQLASSQAIHWRRCRACCWSVSVRRNLSLSMRRNCRAGDRDPAVEPRNEGCRPE